MLIDQVFSSVSNGIFTFAVAVASTTQSFGEIILMFTALITVLGVQRGAVGTPLLLKSDQTTEQIRWDGSFALVAGLVGTGCAVLVVMVTCGHAVGLSLGSPRPDGLRWYGGGPADDAPSRRLRALGESRLATPDQVLSLGAVVRTGPACASHRASRVLRDLGGFRGGCSFSRRSIEVRI